MTNATKGILMRARPSTQVELTLGREFDAPIGRLKTYAQVTQIMDSSILIQQNDSRKRVDRTVQILLFDFGECRAQFGLEIVLIFQPDRKPDQSIADTAGRSFGDCHELVRRPGRVRDRRSRIRQCW